jgi:hypothetical protein
VLHLGDCCIKNTTSLCLLNISGAGVIARDPVAELIRLWETRRIAFTFRHPCFDGIGAALFIARTVERALGERLVPLAIGRQREGFSLRHLH